jgi:hypothetical protein
MSYKRKAGKRFPALPAQGWQGLLWEGYRAQGADPRGEYRATLRARHTDVTWNMDARAVR